MFGIQTMCKVLSVSRAGFYAWCKRPESQRKCDDKRFLSIIKDRFIKSRKTYGYRRIHDDFVDLNEPCGKNRIARIMNENNIRPKTKRKFKVTTDSKHTLKTECVYHEKYQIRDDAKKSVFDYIEVFYNRQRKHSFLGYQSPEQYELASGL